MKARQVEAGRGTVDPRLSSLFSLVLVVSIFQRRNTGSEGPVGEVKGRGRGRAREGGGEVSREFSPEG